MDKKKRPTASRKSAAAAAAATAAAVEAAAVEAFDKVGTPERRPQQEAPAKRSAAAAAEVALATATAVAPYSERGSAGEAAATAASVVEAAITTPEAKLSALEAGAEAVAAAVAAAQRYRAPPTTPKTAPGGGEGSSAVTPATPSSPPAEAEWREWGGEDEEEGGGRRSPVITVLFSRPQLWSPQTVDLVDEEEPCPRGQPPCSVLAGAGRICKFLKGPPLLPPGFALSPADATLRALRSIDFSGPMAALSDDDDDESEALSSEKKEADEVDDTDFEGIARWRKSHGADYRVVDEELSRDRFSGQDSGDYSSSEESEFQAGKYSPIIWFPEKAQFQLYWDLWDPRASVRDVDEEEEGPVKNRRERAADLLQDIINYFRNAPAERECSEMLTMSVDEGEEDILEGIDWYNLPFSDIDDELREKIYKKYVNEFLKEKEKIMKCPEEPLTDEVIENLRNMQYRAARWLTKQLDNEYSFLPKKEKDKILIPRDPTFDDQVTIVLSQIVGKVGRPDIDDKDIQDLIFDEMEKMEKQKPRKTIDQDILMDALRKRISEREIEKALMEGVDRYIDDKDPNMRDVIMDAIDKHEIEKSIKDIVSDVRDDAIGGDARVVAKDIVKGMLDQTVETEKNAIDFIDSIIEGLEDEEYAEETPEGEEMSSTTSSSHLGIQLILAKFHLENKRCFCREYKLLVDLNDIRTDLSTLCEVPEEMIVLELGGKVLLSRNILMTNTTLRDIRKPGSEVIDFKLKSIDDLRYPLRTYELTKETPRVQTRVIDVVMDKYETRHISLTVLDDCIVKPYIGGFRNKSTGMEFHNAFSQTGPFLRRVDRCHRDTQTSVLKNANIETVQHKQTQMWRRDCYITAEYDYIIPATPYLDADTFFMLMRYEEMAIRIQRFWRRFVMRKYLKQLADRARACKQYEIEREQKRLKEISERHRKVLVHKTYPRTKADFDMWYAMIEMWRVEETEKATELMDAAGRKASLQRAHLLEVELLRELEAHRTHLREEKREKRDLALIDACAKPLEWSGKDGCIVSMDTTRTQRARELCHLYHALARKDVTLEERMEVLMQLKYALVPYPKVVPTQLIRLVERESELLLAGLRRHDQIDVLHKRVLQMYLELLKDPEFNPEAAKHSLEYNVSQQEYTYHQCPRCSRLKKKVDMSMDATTRSLQHCELCAWVQHIGSRRYDMGPYRDLMRAVRRDEAKRKAYTSVAFVMRDADFYWLILNLWHAESFLTEAEDISDMRMPRWDVRKEWSPWNCILLTDDESKWHQRLQQLEDGYSQELMGEVHSRHVTARLHFRDLVRTDKYFRESCKWFDVSRKKTYVPPSLEADVFQGLSLRCPLPQAFKH